jgi:hypothetical protein
MGVMGMRKLLAVGIIGVGLLMGCSSEPATTQYECLRQDKFMYEGECLYWDEIPTYAQEDVMLEVANEIAISNDISVNEALMLMNEIISGY